ncbi:MAG: LPS assembly protein LptD [bacterium]
MATSEDDITIDAESLTYDTKGESLSATGDVLIRRGDTTLRADSVQYNRRTSEARAIGDTVLTSPRAEIRADAMFLDMENETGDLQGASIVSDRLGYSLSGRHIEKGLGQRYHIEHGRFTTCDCGGSAPSWSISGEKLDVEVDGYGTLEGGTFNILDHPVMWLPRAAFPVFRERQSGLLFPRVGISNRRGFQILQPYYFEIDKTQDATISFDLETSLRIGLIGEYRYAPSQATQGAFQVAYFNDLFRGQTDNVRVPPGADPNAPENRWAVIGHHSQGIPQLEGTSGYVDLLVVGDDLFLREMNTFAVDYQQDVALRTLPFTTSQAGVLKEWERAAVQTEAIFYQDLVGPQVEQPNGNITENESLVIQRLPEVRLQAQKQLGFELIGDTTGSVTNFQRSLGLAGFRGDFKPSAELRLPLGRSLFGSIRAAFRETAYGLTENEMSGGFTGADPSLPEIDLPSTSHREIFELHGNVGTELARIYDFPHFGLDKLRHTIEPQVEYLYVPPVNQSDLPVFDGIDRINKRSLITYGFASRLLGRTEVTSQSKKSGEVFEIARLSVAQSYDVLRDIPPTTNIDSVTGQPVNPETGDHFSDIDVALRVNPGPITSVRAYTTYDTSENQVSSATVGVRFKEPLRGFDGANRPRLFTRASFNIEYRYVTDKILQFLDSSLALPVTDRIAGLYAIRYDVLNNRFLENYAGVRWLSSCDCWALNLGFKQTTNPNEVQLQAQFTLAGLGAPAPGGF